MGSTSGRVDYTLANDKVGAVKQNIPEPGHTIPSHSRRRHFVAICIYALLAVIMTWPLISHFNSDVIAEHYFDRLQNLWNIWWTKVALLDQHTNPFHTNLLLYPQGADLYFHTLNLPSTLVTLLPFVLFGLAAAYNASIFFALVMSGYAGFRLVYYLTNNHAAAFVGGMIIGFNPLTSVMIRAQINIASLQWFLLCIEFFLRGWNEGGRRNALLSGLFFSLAVLTVGYFEIYLLFFLFAFLVWALFSRSIASWRERIKALARRGWPLLIWGGGITLLLIGPYLVGSWLSLQKGQIVAVSVNDQTRTMLNSADLLSFFVPNRGHWLLGGDAPWWQGISPAIHDYTYLGAVTLGLAAIGVWFRRRQAVTWMWVTLGVLGAVLALGPALQVNNAQTLGFMPFAFLQKVPLLGLARSPERFVILTYLSLGVLAGWGVLRLLKQSSPVRRALVVAGVVGLLLLETPLRTRQLAPIVIPSSLASLGGEGTAPGAVLELPLTQHGRVDVPRMLYQTAHGRPITSAYLSREVIDPYEQACSPLRPFRDAPEGVFQAPTPDIISPTAALQDLGSLLGENGFAYIAVYKQGFYDQGELTPVPERQLSALQEIAGRLGAPTADDDMATIYRLRVASESEKVALFMQLGENWHRAEDSHGLPFRWINGAAATICVHSPTHHFASLRMQAASFGSLRRLQVWVGEEKVTEVAVPADGALHSLTTSDIEWPVGPQSVRFVVPEGSVSPAKVGQGGDTRQLSIGLSIIRLEEKGSVVGCGICWGMRLR